MTVPSPRDAAVWVTYVRGPSRRVFDTADGVSRRIEFERGVAQEISAADARRVMDLAPGRFDAATVALIADGDDPPTTGNTTTPKEG